MGELTVTMEKGKGKTSVPVVKVSGSMTVQYMAELKTGLLQALEAGNELSLDLSGVTEVDLSGLQLLCAAHRSSLQAEKRFVLNPGGCDVIRTASIESGFNRHVGCLRDKDKTCFWLGGTE